MNTSSNQAQGASGRQTKGPWELKATYGCAEQANRVIWWHAERWVDGRRETFKDERGVMCFDYRDLVAAIAAIQSTNASSEG